MSFGLKRNCDRMTIKMRKKTHLRGKDDAECLASAVLRSYTNRITIIIKCCSVSSMMGFACKISESFNL